MDLLIRSQDKMDLFKINRLKIREHTFKDGKKEYFILNNNSISDVVGVYKTKERALEILDEIQKIHSPRGIIKFNGIVNAETMQQVKKYFKEDYIVGDSRLEKIELADCYVYEMPQE